MTQINIDCFKAAIIATDELKNLFRQMADEDKTPMNFGLAVRKAPETLDTNLLVTARNKCKNSATYKRIISLGGKVIDTSKIYKNKETNENNKQAVEKLLEEARFEGKIFEIAQSDTGYKMLLGVNRELICKFIARIKYPLANKSFDKDGIIQLIKKQDSLSTWDVVFAKGNRQDVGAFDYHFTGITGRAVFRSFISRKKECFIRIADSNNRLADPNLFRIGLTLEQYEDLKQSNNGKSTFQAAEYLKYDRKPLLIIYPIWLNAFDDEKRNQKFRGELDSEEIENMFKGDPLLGIALGFPGKAGDNIEAEYLYNKIKIDQILSEDGEEDVDDDEIYMEED